MATGIRPLFQVGSHDIDPVPGPQDLSTNDKGHKPFNLGTFAIDEDRPMRVVIIGAGFTGIIAGIRVAQRVRNVEFAIYEREAGIGGTWFVNKYPGVACDVPAHCYQLTFESNPHWSAVHAPGAEIRAYLERIVEKYKLMQYIKLKHKLASARWDPQGGKWSLTISTPNGDIQDAADIVINCTGALDRWNWPKIDGLFDFKGSVVHSAQWDLEDENAWAGKKVAVIGAGSSALQILPSVQPKAAKVVAFVRGKTWIAPRLSLKMFEANPDSDNYHFTEEDHRKFEDSKYYSEFRHAMEEGANAHHGMTLRGHPTQLAAVAMFREVMDKKLEKKPWIADHIIPDFAVGCRRLGVGPRFLEALTEDNVDFVPEEIKRITPSGIETVDGRHRDFDIIVCATGFDISFKPRYSVIGRDGVSLSDKWHPHPVTYLGVATDGFPNWFHPFGPNTGSGSGSLLIILERQVDYIVEVVLKLQRERLKSLEVKEEAVLAYDEYLEHYFPTTVYSEKCRSWFKQGNEEGRVVAIWPGSSLHAIRALKHPRWEDYNYEQLDEQPGSHNRFHWLGNGWTVNERDQTGDRAWYLTEIDYPPVP